MLRLQKRQIPPHLLKFFRPVGHKPKDLVNIPHYVAEALRADGWYLRQDIIWAKPAPMPESIKDRCTKAHEYIFLLSKRDRYFYDARAIAEESAGRERFGNSGSKSAANGDRKDGDRRNMEPTDTRNRRSVWSITTLPYPGAHFATFPPDLIEPCVKAGSRPGDLVLDPFNGSGTTGFVAQKWGRRYVGIDLNPDYIELSKERFRQRVLFGATA